MSGQSVLSPGFVNTPAESAEQAMSVKDSDGVFFVPAFNGLQVSHYGVHRPRAYVVGALGIDISDTYPLAPINDYQAAAGFIGLKPTTSKHHMVRAILESLVFRVVQLYDTLQQEARCDCSLIRVDGGVTHNDFVCQLLADLIEIKVERPTSTEMSVLGVGFLAGLYSEPVTALLINNVTHLPCHKKRRGVPSMFFELRYFNKARFDNPSYRMVFGNLKRSYAS
uniref:Carbohydrate kinase FGGY C-terminal domain-containing protein n=1 Tax=Timema bartmani TaxID=61472 RepID=A0A7R9ET18_9NEOP|nr:unnamed protein product [Timema bartmani]